MAGITANANPARHLGFGAYGVGSVTNKLKTALAEVKVRHDIGIAHDLPKHDMNGCFHQFTNKWSVNKIS
jgi:hypothetical protein